MSHKIGQVYLATSKKTSYVNLNLKETVGYSEATAELIDGEVREILHTQYEKALTILKDKRSVLKKSAKLLLEKEKIEGEELKEIMDETSVAS